MLIIEFVGHCGSDAEIKEFNGKSFISFNVATSDRYKDAQGNTVSRTTWVSCLKPGDSSVVSYLKKGTQVFVRGDFSAKTFTNANGVQVSINCRVRELQLLSAKQDGAQASQQPKTAQPSTPQAASTAAFAPNPFSSETGKDDLPF